jgi:hypothetical protein
VAYGHDLEGAEDLEGALQSLANSFETTVNQLQAIIGAPAEGMIYWAEMSKKLAFAARRAAGRWPTGGGAHFCGEGDGGPDLGDAAHGCGWR